MDCLIVACFLKIILNFKKKKKKRFDELMLLIWKSDFGFVSQNVPTKWLDSIVEKVLRLATLEKKKKSGQLCIAL